MNDLYEVLQISHRAEPEVVRAAYRALARKHHPDFGGDSGRMAAINDAWAVLGDQALRAAFDAEPQAPNPGRRSTDAAPTDRRATTGPPVGRTGPGIGGRGPQQPHREGSVLNFGRYTGWTIGSLVEHDPDYLEWLKRTPFGRSLTAEIDAALSRREVEAAALRPTPQSTNDRRSFFGSRRSDGATSR